MNRFLNVSTAVVLLLLIVGCTFATRYVKARSSQDFGYADQYLGGNQYQITFRGNQYTKLADAYDKAHRRASEKCAERGGAGYRVIAEESRSFRYREIDPRTDYRVDVSGEPYKQLLGAESGEWKTGTEVLTTIECIDRSK
jgi:hypothetical protein